MASETADSGGPRRIEIAGALTLADGRRLWRELARCFAQAEAAGSDASVDVGGVLLLDGGSAALLAAAIARHRALGHAVEVVGASRDTARMLELYAIPVEAYSGGSAAGLVVEDARVRRHPGMFTEVGNALANAGSGMRAMLAFFGDLTVAIGQAMRRPRTVHFGQFGSLLERAGADGLPIVLLINYLVGAILGLQGAIQLHRFGGDQLLADLVGLSGVREPGPLMTAILVTGRSGAAYAAELGTMTVNEEVDALRTLGQDPHRFLVLPRILTLILVVPLMTLLGNLVGMLGGLTIAVSYLDQLPIVYLRSLQSAIELEDVFTGLLKSLGFAAAIALIACQRGLRTRGGADGVGRATTSAVVASLFTLVVFDALFTWVFAQLGW
ncbi:MAG: ABC transporter permease [Planctomycetota bacterium]